MSTEPEVTALDAAARAFHRAEAALDKRREALASAIAEAARSGVGPTEITRITGYTREHVRRILRAAGIEGTGRRATPPGHDEARSPGEEESGPAHH